MDIFHIFYILAFENWKKKFSLHSTGHAILIYN